MISNDDPICLLNLKPPEDDKVLLDLDISKRKTAVFSFTHREYNFRLDANSKMSGKFLFEFKYGDKELVATRYPWIIGFRQKAKLNVLIGYIVKDKNANSEIMFYGLRDPDSLLKEIDGMIISSVYVRFAQDKPNEMEVDGKRKTMIHAVQSETKKKQGLEVEELTHDPHLKAGPIQGDNPNDMEEEDKVPNDGKLVLYGINITKEDLEYVISQKREKERGALKRTHGRQSHVPSAKRSQNSSVTDDDYERLSARGDAFEEFSEVGIGGRILNVTKITPAEKPDPTLIKALEASLRGVSFQQVNAKAYVPFHVQGVNDDEWVSD